MNDNFYKHGADISVTEFDQRRVPFCRYCDEVKVDFTRIPKTPEEPAHYSLDTFCCDECEDAFRFEKKQRADEEYARMVAEAKAAGRNTMMNINLRRHVPRFRYRVAVAKGLLRPFSVPMGWVSPTDECRRELYIKAVQSVFHRLVDSSAIPLAATPRKRSETTS